MGSTKKRKEKKRSRSRERSSRKRRHHDQDDDDEIQNEEYEDGEIPTQKMKSSVVIPVKSPEKKRRKRERRESGEEPAAASSTSGGGGGASESISVEETNKLRAQLGLAPLEDDSGKSKVKEIKDEDGQAMDVVKVDGAEFVHKPAENWGQKKEADTIREKLQALREKRKIDEKLGKTKLLGEADEEDSAASWVQKTRKAEEEKRLADLRAKMLEQMDEEFGVSEIIEQEKKKTVKKKVTHGYGSKDLAGMTVQHSKTALMASSETILVLQDKDVLDESDDVLVNPTITELEKWKKNAELRKQKPGYNPYDEELDEYGMPKRNLLSKYDEEIDGQKKDSFQLSASGSADMRMEQERAEMLAKLHEGAQSLELPSLKLANEYLTHEEMEQFKKPKKRIRKVRKRVVESLKADDLVASAKLADEDFGSRNRGRGRKKDEYEAGNVRAVSGNREEGEYEEEADQMDTFQQPLDNDVDIILSDDEAEQELQATLARTRQLQQLQQAAETKKVGMERLIEILPKTEPMDEDDEAAMPSNKIVMDSVSEYCRNLGDIPTYGRAGNREDVDESDLIDVEREAKASTSRAIDQEQEDDDDEEEMDDKGGWHERDINETERPPSSASSSSSEGLEREAILGEEPDMNNMGVGAALKLAAQKGYLKDDKAGRGGKAELDHLRSQRYTVMDKQFHDIDDKYAKKLERMGGGGGPIVDFKEKNDYAPNIKLEYADEKGRLMDEKDAFRFLSWKFHGKAPGKRKVEKRNKKLVEKELFNEMSSTDTPLGTLSKQIEKQRQLQAPYIVLSGSGSKDAGSSIRKD